MTSITYAIQAGGRSSRMGTDKGAVLLNHKPLIEHILDRLQPALRNPETEIILTTNHPENYAYLNLPMFQDETPGAGALPGLQTALKAAGGNTVALIACDMPFVSLPLFEYLLTFMNSHDVVVPKWNNRYQPMHALYRRDHVLQAVRDAIQNGEKRMISFFDAVRVKTILEEDVQQVSPGGRAFFNINTPEDLKTAEKILQDWKSPSGS